MLILSSTLLSTSDVAYVTVLHVLERSCAERLTLRRFCNTVCRHERPMVTRDMR